MGYTVPEDIKSQTSYREYLEMLTNYAFEGLKALREVNPITRGKPPESIQRDD